MGTYHAHTTHIPHTYHIHTTHIPHTYHTHTAHIPHTYHTHTTHIPHTYATHISNIYQSQLPIYQLFMSHLPIITHLPIRTPYLPIIHDSSTNYYSSTTTGQISMTMTAITTITRKT